MSSSVVMPQSGWQRLHRDAGRGDGEFARSSDLNASLLAALKRIIESMNAESATLFLLEGELDDPPRAPGGAGLGRADAATGLSLPATAGIVGRPSPAAPPAGRRRTQGFPDFVAPQTIGGGLRSCARSCARP